MRHGRLVPLLALSAITVGSFDCEPHFERAASLVDDVRVLAVVIEPPEALPAARVRAEVLVVGPGGRVTEPAPSWSLCQRRPELAAYNSVADACSRPLEGALEYLGTGSAIDLTVPSAACASFGSEVPPADREGRLIRPVDPDATGGYYQPLRIDVGSQVAFGSPRLACALPRASADVIRAFREQYVPNTNPVMPALELPTKVRRGERLAVSARVSEASREKYVVYHVETGTLEARSEILEARFFTTAGAFSNDTVSGGGDLVGQLTLPTVPGSVHLWVIVNDERGGTAFREAEVLVE